MLRLFALCYLCVNYIPVAYFDGRETKISGVGEISLLSLGFERFFCLGRFYFSFVGEATTVVAATGTLFQLTLRSRVEMDLVVRLVK